MERSRSTRTEAWAAFISFLLSTGAYVHLVRPPVSGREGETDPLLQVVWIPLYLAAVLLVVDRKAVAGGRRLQAAAAGFIVGALVTTLWSIAPFVTFRRAVAFAGTVAIAAAMAKRLSFRRAMALLQLALGVLAVSSLVLLLVLPQLAYDLRYVDAVRGVSYEKNEFGRLMALGFVLSIVRWNVSARLLRWVAAPGFFVMVLLADSKTALTALVITCITFPLVTSILTPRTRDLGLGIACFIGAAGLWVFTALLRPTDLIVALGRDATLTGRTQLWSSVVSAISERPLGGYGYGAFWAGTPHPGAILVRPGFQASHAHDGYLDLMLNFGILGLLIFLGFLAWCLHRGSVSRSGRSRHGAVGLATFLLVYNVTESSLLVHNSTFTLVLLYICFRALLDPDNPGPDPHPSSPTSLAN